MLKKIRAEPEIFSSKVGHVVAKIDNQLFEFFSLKGNWQVTRVFSVLFLSWDIDYRIENLKS
jgi:hypothetical protein